MKISIRWCILHRDSTVFSILVSMGTVENSHSDSWILKRSVLYASLITFALITFRENARNATVEHSKWVSFHRKQHRGQRKASYKEMSGDCRINVRRKSPFRDALSLTGRDKPFSAQRPRCVFTDSPCVVKCTRTEWEHMNARERTSNSRWTWSSLPISLFLPLSFSIYGGNHVLASKIWERALDDSH